MTSELHRISSSSSPLRCAVIGMGMGKNHAGAILEHPNAQLVAAVDARPDRLDHLRVRPDAPELFADHKEMLQKTRPDLVVIALPNYLHKPVTLDALAAGAHVLCEKPVATSVADAEEMRAAAIAAKRQLGINFSQRFFSMSRALKDIAINGSLGDIYHSYCSWTRRDGFPGFGGWFGQKSLSGGGPLIDLGVHRLDLAMWLMGNPRIATVSGMAHQKIGVPRAQKLKVSFDVEDFATGLVRFDNGASLIFEVSWAGHQRSDNTQQLRVVGTDGALEQNETGSFHHFSRNGIFFTTQIDTGKTTAPNSVQEMINSIITGQPFSGTIDQGITVQKILNGLYTSAATGREVSYQD